MDEPSAARARCAVLPAVRDVGVAIFELSGWSLAQLLGLLAPRVRPRPTTAAPALLLLFVLAVALLGAVAGEWRVLAFWLIPLVIVMIHAADLTRARAQLREAVHPPHPLPPDISEEAATRSPALGALHQTARVVSLSFCGRWLDAQNEAARVERGRLDEQSAQLLDAARAFAELSAGDRGRAAQLAIVSLPSGEEAIDRELAVCVLAAAWEDDDRLRAVEKGWARAEAAAVMRSLAVLASVRLRARAGGDPAEGFDRDTLRQLAADARAVGDEALADRLLACSQMAGPYR